MYYSVKTTIIPQYLKEGQPTPHTQQMAETPLPPKND